MKTAAARYRGFLQIECGFSVNTIASYMRDVGDLFDDLAEAKVKKVGDAQPRHLVEHVQALRAKKKMASSSVVRHHAAIRSFFRWARGAGLVTDDPSEWVATSVLRKNLSV